MNPNGELRKSIEQEARAKLRLLDALSAEGMEVSSLRVSGSLSTTGILVEVLVHVPLRRHQPAQRRRSP